MIRVEAVNNEHMWIDEKRVIMVGPLMDRGVRQLGRAVLYFDELPPLPCKETVDELAERVEGGVKHGILAEGETGSGDHSGRDDSGTGSQLVVPA